MKIARTLFAALVTSLPSTHTAFAEDVTFEASADSVGCYDFVEVKIESAPVSVRNPLDDITVEGSFTLDGDTPIEVDGFCDSDVGRIFRIRFMPVKPGSYGYIVRYSDGARTQTHEGRFTAVDKRQKGMLRIDQQYPAHFQWSSSQERFFWNGLTADELAQLDEAAMSDRLDQLDRCRITGLRFELTPPKGSASSYLESWSRLDRLVAAARTRNIAFAVTVPPVRDPANPAHEWRFIRYAVARLAAFSNVIWEPTDPRQPSTAADTCDPYDHLTAKVAQLLPLVSGPSLHEQDATVPDPAATTIRAMWEHVFAGGYSTLDFSNRNALPDETALACTLDLYGQIYDFFTGIPWWELHPEPGLVVALHPNASGTAAPRAFAARNDEGDLAAIYIQDGGIITVKGDLLKDQLKPLWFSPRDGGMRNARAVRPHVYRTPTAEDWVLLFRTPCNCSFRDFDSEFEP